MVSICHATLIRRDAAEIVWPGRFRYHSMPRRCRRGRAGQGGWVNRKLSEMAARPTIVGHPRNLGGRVPFMKHILALTLLLLGLVPALPAVPGGDDRLKPTNLEKINTEADEVDPHATADG